MAQVSINNPEYCKKDPRWKNKKKVQVQARKLSDILDQNSIDKIDFFSLDVEGYELNVLNGIDFSRHAPELICTEIRNKNNSQSFFPIKSLLEDNQYTLISSVGHNYFFQRMI